MQAKGAFRWLEEELGKRSRLLVPGETLLLKDDSQGQVVFFVFTRPKKVKSSEVSGQIFLLDPGVDGDAGGSYFNDGATYSSYSAFPPMPSDGGGGTVSISGSTDVVGSVSHSIGFGVIHASIKAKGTHTSLTNDIVAKITVKAELTFSGATPGSCWQSNSHDISVTCNTDLTAQKDIPIFGCTILNATGKASHSFSDRTKIPSSGYSNSSGNCTFTFNCGVDEKGTTW